MKAYEVARYLEKPDLNRGAFLVFGPNQGLVFETSNRLIRYFSAIPDQPLEKITLEAAQIIEDPSLLALHAATIPMFGTVSAVRVRNANRRLTPILHELLETRPEAIFILEADNLPPRDSLRALMEKNPHARTLPCYADDERAVGELIKEAFAREKIRIEPEAVTLLRETLGSDREILRREIEKLALYAAKSKTIVPKEIIALCGDSSNITIDEIVDAAGTGHVERLDKAISKALGSALDPQRLLISALLHFSWLRQLRVEIDKGNSVSGVLGSQKPRPHFSRKTALEQQLRLWSDERLASATSRIYRAIAHSRKTAPLAASITHRALIAIGVAAARY